MRLSAVASIAVLAAALSVASLGGRAQADDKPKPDKPLAGVMSCLRGSNNMVVVSNAGAGMGAPENSLAAFDKVLPYAPVIKIDVAASGEGVMFLMRDATLERTTTGKGPVGETYWADIQPLKLKDANGAPTNLSVPTFEDALNWSAGKAVLMVDKRVNATWAEIMILVRQKGAEDRVIAIVQSPTEVADIRRYSQRVGVRFDLRSADDWKRMRDLDVASNSLMGWTAGSQPNPELWKAAKKKVAIGFSSGSSGAPGASMDAGIAASGDLGQYDWFAQNGVDFLLSDAPQNASTSKNAAKGRKSCLNK